MSLDLIDPIFEINVLGPTLQSEVRFIGKGNLGVPGGTSDTEAWILSALSKRARNIFEFGTCTGKTTYLMACNSPKDACVTTLTLRPNQIDQYEREKRDNQRAINDAITESAFENFLYTNTLEEDKIIQLYGDSKHFDHSAYIGKMDLIFIDGSHAYSYVMSDTKKAMEMLAPNGIILWHDYRGPRETKDVFKALNELSKLYTLIHLKETSIVMFRKEKPFTTHL